MNKFDHLEKMIKGLQSATVAFSGGNDSTSLLHFVWTQLQDRVIAVSVKTPYTIPAEIDRACSFTKQYRIRHIIIPLKIPAAVRNNPHDRCYHCKQTIFTQINRTAHQLRTGNVVEASVTDDLADYRPGIKALRELGIRSPLIEAEISKKDILHYMTEHNLLDWNHPSDSCLATRIQIGEEITFDKCTKINQAEELLRQQGFKNVRVRLIGTQVRIEVDQDQTGELRSNMDSLVPLIQKIGFNKITYAPEGYQKGAMNEVLDDRYEFKQDDRQI